MENILAYTFLNNSLNAYLIALIAFVLTFSILKLFKKVVVDKLKKIADRTPTKIDDLAIKCIGLMGWPLYVVLAFWVPLQILDLSEKVEKHFSNLLLIVFVYYIAKISQEFVSFGISKIIEKRKKEDGSGIKVLNNVLKAVIWSVAVLIILQNLGLNISALIAGLGIGGLAIALALQAILGDILACFSIYFDRPFEIGDFIIIGSDMGVVKKIGIKSTRIESLWGEELVISNKELIETRVQNYKKMEKRRVEFNFGVRYETPAEKLKRIPGIVREIMEEIELAQLDRVHFQKFGDFGLTFVVIYYVLIPDYSKYMDIQQEINFTLKERLEKEGIRFAHPVQRVFLSKED